MFFRQLNQSNIMDINRLSSKIIGAAIDVHKALGPGLLESAYEEGICHEMSLRRLSFERQKTLPVIYKGPNLIVVTGWMWLLKRQSYLN